MHNMDTLFSSKKQDWTTPKDLFDTLNNEFHFTLDPCCTHENALCIKHYTEAENGLVKHWTNEIVFCNPPYNNIEAWARKCAVEYFFNAVTVVMLVPARTDTKWFHNWVLPYARSIRFIKGRLHFGGANSAPFPSILVIYTPKRINSLENYIEANDLEWVNASNISQSIIID